MTDFYGTDTGFTAYHTERGNIIPDDAATPDDINIALLVASEWIDARFKSMFGGLKTGTRDQLREWPRVGHVAEYNYTIPSDQIPREIEKATYEIAMKHFVAPETLRIDLTPNKYKQVSVDGAVSATYNDYTSSDEVQVQFQIINEILSSLFYKDVNGNANKLCGSSIRK